VIDRVLFDWAPIAIAAVVGCFFADYTLTHVGARANELVRDRWRVEGSYEMNPTWERQIDSRRWFSPRVVLTPLAIALVLVTIRVLAEVVDVYADPAYFGAAVGVMLLIQAPILLLHGMNLQTFRLLLDPTAATGGIVYRRWFVYRQSVVYVLGFSVLWLVLWLPSQQAFFLGGAASCAVFARSFWRLAAKARATAATPAPVVDNSVTESRH
jgi:hypothetical protein